MSVPVAFTISTQLSAHFGNMLWFIDIPSVMGVFWILYAVFERWLWRWARSFKVVSSPDLTGEWTVTGKTTHDKFQSEWSGTATIHQTWSRILVVLETDKSMSRSLSASIFGYSHKPELSYEYFNEPKAAAIDTMQPHRGVARLRVETSDRMVGDYFNGRGRAEFGEITFSRKK